MKPTLVFASSNAHKIEEVSAIIGDQFNILGLKDIKCFEEIPETQDTIEGNAIQKAAYVKEHYGYDCFADDTGLEIEALNNEPGIYSARYAGPERSAEANMNKVLQGLSDKDNRKARFKTVVAFSMGSEMQTFEGITTGQIIEDKKGEGGFGYDPIFKPSGYENTMAEIPSEEKNKISSRARAVESFVSFLHSRSTNK